jgi:hypothetical protein
MIKIVRAVAAAARISGIVVLCMGSIRDFS